MEPRTKRVVISVTPTEKKLLSNLAEYEGRLSLTATIRHILMEAVRMRGLDISERSESNSTSFIKMEQERRPMK